MKTSRQIFKFIAFGIALTCLFACAAGVLVACDKTPEVHDVLIEVINPQNGEAIVYPHHAKFSAPEQNTRIEVRIKDRVTGEYLTDKDLVGSSLEASTSILISCYSDWSERLAQDGYLSDFWPSSESQYRIFRLTVTFTYPLPTQDNIGELDLRCKTSTLVVWCEYV